TLIPVPLPRVGQASASHGTSPPLAPARCPLALNGYGYSARSLQRGPTIHLSASEGSALCPLQVLLRNDSAGERLRSSGCRRSHASQLGRGGRPVCGPS